MLLCLCLCLCLCPYLYPCHTRRPLLPSLPPSPLSPCLKWTRPKTRRKTTEQEAAEWGRLTIPLLLLQPPLVATGTLQQRLPRRVAAAAAAAATISSHANRTRCFSTTAWPSRHPRPRQPRASLRRLLPRRRQRRKAAALVRRGRLKRPPRRRQSKVRRQVQQQRRRRRRRRRAPRPLRCPPSPRARLQTSSAR